MQLHMPIGYKMVEGKIQLDEEKAKNVKNIFIDYLEGKSLLAIAKQLKEKKIPNANNRTNWTHGAVGRILENTRYMGDDFYPPLIAKEVFDKIQKKRKQRKKQLGRTAQLNSMKNQTVFANKIFCGECGEPYKKYIEHCGKPWESSKWKCKKYIFNNQVNCRNLFYTDDEIKAIFISEVNKLIIKKSMLDKSHKKDPPPISKELREVENSIKEMEEQEKFSSPDLAMLIFKRAELAYKCSKIDNYEFNTQRIKECLEDVHELTDFDEELFKSILSKIIIYKDGKVETEFINGLRISEILEYKRKDEKNGCSKKDGGNHTSTDEI